jgi:peptidyl-prolyl cis-trans isomerase A (cyclophilin A)
MRTLRFLPFLCVLAVPVGAVPRPDSLPRVAIKTTEGTIVVELETKRAPITAANFLHYVDAHRLEGTYFYRAARAKSNPRRGLIQGGVDHNMPKTFFAIKHEPTNVTGLKHVDGTISMARNDPGTAMGDFFITVGPAPGLDASPGYAGYAAFGHVVRGMDVAYRILAKPTYPGGYSRDTMGQSIRDRVKILSTTRVK